MLFYFERYRKSHDNGTGTATERTDDGAAEGEDLSNMRSSEILESSTVLVERGAGSFIGEAALSVPQTPFKYAFDVVTRVYTANTVVCGSTSQQDQPLRKYRNARGKVVDGLLMQLHCWQLRRRTGSTAGGAGPLLFAPHELSRRCIFTRSTLMR